MCPAEAGKPEAAAVRVGTPCAHLCQPALIENQVGRAAGGGHFVYNTSIGSRAVRGQFAGSGMEGSEQSRVWPVACTARSLFPCPSVFAGAGSPARLEPHLPSHHAMCLLLRRPVQWSCAQHFLCEVQTELLVLPSLFVVVVPSRVNKTNLYFPPDEG